MMSHPRPVSSLTNERNYLNFDSTIFFIIADQRKLSSVTSPKGSQNKSVNSDKKLLPAQASIDYSKDSLIPSTSKRPSVSEALVQQLSEDKDLQKTVMSNDKSTLPSHNDVSAMLPAKVDRKDEIQSYGKQSAASQNEKNIIRNFSSAKHPSDPKVGQEKETGIVTTDGGKRHGCFSASDKSPGHINSYKSNTCSKYSGVEVSNSGNQVRLETAVFVSCAFSLVKTHL